MRANLLLPEPDNFQANVIGKSSGSVFDSAGAKIKILGLGFEPYAGASLQFPIERGADENCCLLRAQGTSGYPEDSISLR
jgi:hypothetical protein